MQNYEVSFDKDGIYDNELVPNFEENNVSHLHIYIILKYKNRCIQKSHICRLYIHTYLQTIFLAYIM